jgi:alpha-D-xyloside xylohydrolase
MTITVRRDPYLLEIRGRDGRVKLREEPYDHNARKQYYRYPTGHSTSHWWFTGALRPDTAIFGLGEHFGPLNHRGHEITSWTSNALGVRGEHAYKNVPLLLTTDGYGLLLDMTQPLHYDLGHASSGSWSITARADHLRFYVLLGATPRAQIALYHRLTGKPAVPPAWSLGLWMSRWGYKSQREILDIAQRVRAEDIPCDVIHLDPYWLQSHEGHHCDFAWNTADFPDPQAMIDQLRRLGFRLSIWESPYVPEGSSMFTEGARHGYLIVDSTGTPVILRQWKAASGIVDFTNPAAERWFQDKNVALLKMGVAVMKADFGEELPMDALAHDGTTGEALHNLYPLLYQRAVSDATFEVHGYRLIWARSGYSGSQRYPVHWGGDPGNTFNDMAASLRGALSWVMSGMTFASFDIGGFYGLPHLEERSSPEVFVRWAQMGLLFSHARVHGNGSPKEPWEYGPETLQIFRRYAKLRYRLLPYLYTAALKASLGEPLVRPLVFDYPADRTTHHLDDQYLLGPHLLIAPVFERAGMRAVYLPAGGWYDFWSNEFHVGASWITRPSPLDLVPVYVRAGTVLPLGPELNYSGEGDWDPLECHVYLDSRDRAAGELTDERRHLLFRYRDARLTVSQGILGYRPSVVVHKPGTLGGITHD